MGNAEGTQGGNGTAGLRFVQILEDRHFGEVHIFRSEQGRFIMRVSKTFIENDDRQRQFQRVLQWSATAGEGGTVPVLHVETVREKGICIQYEVSHLYTEYYNYTLLDLLASKKDIEEPELWCLLEALLRLTAALDRSQLAIALHLDNVFLTLKGRPCVYLYHLQSIEENIHYSMAQLAGKVVLQLATGQQLEEGREDEPMALLAPISKLCGRYKILGRVVKELINGEKTEEQTLQEMDQMVAVGKIKRANEIKLNKFKYLIPDGNSQSFETQLSSKKETKPLEFKPQKRIDESQRKPKPSAEKVKESQKKPLVEGSNTKPNEMIVSKQDASKMLIELEKRKEENRLQMERFQLRKEELLNHSQKQNRQMAENHPRLTEYLRQSDKRPPSTTAPQRRAMDNSRHSRRR